MGSTLEYIECPNCKQPDCLDDYFYKTGEEYVNCPDCGYQRIFRYKRDENGKFVRKDDTKDYTFDNLISEEIHVEQPYGAFRVTGINCASECGTLKTEEDYQQLVSHVVSFVNQENEIKEVTVSRFVDGEIKKEIIYQKLAEPAPVATGIAYTEPIGLSKERQDELDDLDDAQPA